MAYKPNRRAFLGLGLAGLEYCGALYACVSDGQQATALSDQSKHTSIRGPIGPQETSGGVVCRPPELYADMARQKARRDGMQHDHRQGWCCLAMIGCATVVLLTVSASVGLVGLMLPVFTALTMLWVLSTCGQVLRWQHGPWTLISN
jgi:hypothetical protein